MLAFQHCLPRSAIDAPRKTRREVPPTTSKATQLRLCMTNPSTTTEDIDSMIGLLADSLTPPDARPGHCQVGRGPGGWERLGGTAIKRRAGLHRRWGSAFGRAHPHGIAERG